MNNVIDGDFEDAEIVNEDGTVDKKPEGFFGKIKNMFTSAVNWISGVIVSGWNWMKNKMGNYASALWIVVGVLILTAFSPAAGFSAMMFVISLAIYVAIFITIWNIISNVATSTA